MRMTRRVAGFRAGAWAAVLVAAQAGAAWGGTALLQADSGGRIRPVKLRGVSLSSFVEEYARVSGRRIDAGGKWEEELKGSVTLYLHRPISRETLAEVFHQVLKDNGYAAVDAPGKGGGWIVQRTRDARDAPLPVYDSTEFPDSYRLMTVFHSVRHASAEQVARAMRSYMPPNSRIIPAMGAQVAVTDVGRNIKKVLRLVELLDTEAAAAKSRDEASEAGSARSCPEPEQRIGTVVVEKLEVKEASGLAAGGPGTPPKPQGGGRK